MDINAAIKDLVEKTPMNSKERWRGAAAIWMNYSAKNREEAMANAQYSKKQRESAFNEFGTSGDKNSAMRSPIGMPQGMLMTIEVADPTLFADKDLVKDNIRRLARAFPEFVTVERL